MNDKVKNVKDIVMDYKNLYDLITENKADTEKSLLKDVLAEAIDNKLGEENNDEDETVPEDIAVEPNDDALTEPQSAPSDINSDETDVEDISALEPFKIEDSENEYDLRNADSETVIKAYKLMNPETDQVAVVYDKDKQQVNLKDDDTEYIISLSDLDEPNETDFNVSENMGKSDNVIFEVALDEEQEIIDDYQKETAATMPSTKGAKGRQIDDGLPNSDGKPFPSKIGSKQNNPFTLSPRTKAMNEAQEIIDDYQKETAATMPSTKGAKGRQIDDGLPNSDGKPFPGKVGGKQNKPYSVNEEDMAFNEEVEDIEENLTVSGRAQRNGSKGRKSSNSIRGRRNSDRGVYHPIDEGMMDSYKKMVKENHELKNAIKDFQKVLAETAINYKNLTYVVKLMTENTTTKAEKKNILERFTNEAHSLQESKILYNTLKNELQKKPSTNSININEEKVDVKVTPINENKSFPDELNKILRLM